MFDLYTRTMECEIKDGLADAIHRRSRSILNILDVQEQIMCDAEPLAAFDKLTQVRAAHLPFSSE